jgi:hypothetical protein
MLYLISKDRLELMKAHFINQIKKIREEEKLYCLKNNTSPMMDEKAYIQVCKWIEMIEDPYQLEAMNKAIFQYNVIPESYNQIKEAGEKLKEVYDSNGTSMELASN